MNSIVILLISLVIILAGAELFTNGVEWLGRKLDLSDGAVGSVLAAVGTALPETMIPLIAMIRGGADSVDVGIGAIIGAPLMLATLAMFVTGLSVVIFRNTRQHGLTVKANPVVMRRDLGFFLIVFTAALVTGTMPPEMRKWQLMAAGFMVFAYVYYVWVALTAEEEKDEEDLKACYFAPGRLDPRMAAIVIQLVFSLALIVGGAHLFVGGIENLAAMFGIPSLVLALVIAPVATELPEKFNSFLWVSRGKDTLALGNITGAMVFQSSLIPAMGIFLSDWQLGSGAILTGFLALLSAAIIFIQLLIYQRIKTGSLLFAGVFYLMFIAMVLQGIIS